MFFFIIDASWEGGKWGNACRIPKAWECLGFWEPAGLGFSSFRGPVSRHKATTWECQCQIQPCHPQQTGLAGSPSTRVCLFLGVGAPMEFLPINKVNSPTTHQGLLGSLGPGSYRLHGKSPNWARHWGSVPHGVGLGCRNVWPGLQQGGGQGHTGVSLGWAGVMSFLSPKQASRPGLGNGANSPTNGECWVKGSHQRAIACLGIWEWGWVGNRPGQSTGRQ